MILKIVSKKSKALPAEKLTAPTATDNSFSQQVNGMEVQIFVWYLKEAA